MVKKGGVPDVVRTVGVGVEGDEPALGESAPQPSRTSSIREVSEEDASSGDGRRNREPHQRWMSEGSARPLRQTHYIAIHTEASKSLKQVYLVSSKVSVGHVSSISLRASASWAVAVSPQSLLIVAQSIAYSHQ